MHGYPPGLDVRFAEPFAAALGVLNQIVVAIVGEPVRHEYLGHLIGPLAPARTGPQLARYLAGGEVTIWNDTALGLNGSA